MAHAHLEANSLVEKFSNEFLCFKNICNFLKCKYPIPSKLYKLELAIGEKPAPAATDAI